MQQVKSYWRVVLGAGVVSAFLGAACTVTTSTDGPSFAEAGDGNVSGSPSAGSPSAGAPSGGASGSGTAGSGTAGSSTAGTGGTATSFVCDPEEAGATGNPNSHACEMSAGETKCDKCIRTSCCTEYANCYATDPGNQCGYGGPDNRGEFTCYTKCLQTAFGKNGGITAEDKGTCAANCATPKDTQGSDCRSAIGSATNDLTVCIANTIGCEMDCYGG